MMLKRYTRLCIPDLSGRNLESSTKHVRGKKKQNLKMTILKFV